MKRNSLIKSHRAAFQVEEMVCAKAWRQERVVVAATEGASVAGT